MVSSITNGIKVSVEVFYQIDFSRPKFNEFIFTYRVNIENGSPYTVRLLARHWHIFDSINKHSEVKGDGVVGRQPILEPNQSYSYVSGCNLESELGYMEGSYTMERISNGKLFTVDIPVFTLEATPKLN
ncbi:MAG: Co2+/Mg2+ efflux protein ApaG [Chitinophagales bacterium]|nr:Co2+/Mg2+ efflux protein ApaG [Bacteroidota bacterium]